MTWLDREYVLSIGAHIINKNVGFANWADGFERLSCTIWNLKESIELGYAYCVELRNGHRAKENFVSTSILSVDVDEGMTLDEAKAHPLVAAYATFIYTTCSHTPEAHRFRIGFALEHPITDPVAATAATRSLLLRLSGDGSTDDAARMFFGNSNTQVELFDRGLPQSVLDELVAQSEGFVRSQKPKLTDLSSRSALHIDPDLLVRLEGGPSVPFSDLRLKNRVHCPFHNDRKASAFVTQNRGGEYGIHCQACRTTYWPTGVRGAFHFDHFDKLARLIHDQKPIEVEQQDPVARLLGWKEFQSSRVRYVNTPYIEPFPFEPGITFIKSGKGTGKTQLLKSLSLHDKERVLLVGHRRTLIRASCRRLEVNCYLEEADQFGVPPRWKDRYGVCLDSISKVDLEKPYDYVILDESEQLLAHLLSETIKDRRSEVLRRLMHVLSTAKRIIVLDADLSWPSFHFITRWANTREEKKSQLVINLHKRQRGSLTMVSTRNELIGDLKRSVVDGKKCFLTSNSRSGIDKIEAGLKEEFPDLRILKVTAETGQNPETQMFLERPAEEAKKYDLIMASPSMSTGVDITFEGNAVYFDAVYGLFEPLMLTHFECDQQLARVRHPGEVKVYVSPQQFRFETDISVVQDDLRNRGRFPGDQA
ncbi:plasmid replication protein, CyRepA1 family [Aquibium sp. ELW1220]|uniref:plasmid replication protein, CyRepA1 family n=1 Tax=Aquibium sp. ELW1220 TaxID=2976766 RepID=UPI0025AF53CF|nr:plasmid replication protein, CyRepA1 family [Aquibium sp. ELW1220]MDN2581872.1 DEAD/DEAH box helicase family protein [Aquibium sp. ELW1220]